MEGYVRVMIYAYHLSHDREQGAREITGNFVAAGPSCTANQLEHLSLHSFIILFNTIPS